MLMVSPAGGNFQKGWYHTMNENILSKRISELRRGAGYTQEQLAARLGVSFQAVSKWENAQSCPDILLLPALADIFHVSIDSLFGRDAGLVPTDRETAPPEASSLPWPDDGAFRFALFHGHEPILDEPTDPLDPRRRVEFCWEGPLHDLYSACSVSCGDVSGSVRAEGDVDCEGVLGHVSAGGDVECVNEEGNVNAGGDEDCNDVEGSVSAGGDVDCGDVGGSLSAGGDVHCGSVGGNLSAGGDVDCGPVGGSVRAAGDVDCGSVRGVTVEDDTKGRFVADIDIDFDQMGRDFQDFGKQLGDRISDMISRRFREKEGRNRNEDR